MKYDRLTDEERADLRSDRRDVADADRLMISLRQSLRGTTRQRRHATPAVVSPTKKF
jgi:hypothetical protein